MKWSYNLNHKNKFSLVLLILLIAVFSGNLINDKQVSTLGDSFEAVYADRLIAESYIFRLSEQLFEKKLITEDCLLSDHMTDAGSKIDTRNIEIQDIIIQYEDTKLTKDEAIAFTDFKKIVNQIIFLEQKQFAGNSSAQELALIKSETDEAFRAALVHLKNLSQIQLTEGKFLNDSSRRIVAQNSFLAYLELVLLIIVSIIILDVIFASKTLLLKKPQRAELN
jgi:hypothetical protein